MDTADIDRMLSEASDLSRQLGSELGTTELEPGSLADLASYEEDSPFPRVDAQLEHVENMLKEVAGDTVEASQSDSGDGEQDPLDGGVESVATAEVTGGGSAEDSPPKAHTDSLAPTTARATAASQREDTSGAPPGADSRSEIESLPLPTAEQPMSAPADWGFDEVSAPGDLANALLSDTDPAPNATRPQEAVPSQTAASKSKSALLVSERAARRGLGCVMNIVLRALDAVDGVFANVSYEIRKKLGWVALVVFVAAAAVTAFSLTPWRP